ncbi:hypothetical protein ACG2LH_15415 [Zhouia sp. PK063]|uniref:hypothetical protein n=1 Tax=Zhouia sp. PK063 TaxID=3373602 RepID=UPI0037A23FF1
MTDNFVPPIKSRTTEELLEIVGSPEKWNSQAVYLANNELINRNIKSKKIETAKYLSKKRERIAYKKRENESYEGLDFIFSPLPKLFEILFSVGLKKDGYKRKARQQKYFRIVIGLLVFIIGVALCISYIS